MFQVSQHLQTQVYINITGYKRSPTLSSAQYAYLMSHSLKSSTKKHQQFSQGKGKTVDI